MEKKEIERKGKTGKKRDRKEMERYRKKLKEKKSKELIEEINYVARGHIILNMGEGRKKRIKMQVGRKWRIDDVTKSYGGRKERKGR